MFQRDNVRLHLSEETLSPGIQVVIEGMKDIWDVGYGFHTLTFSQNKLFDLKLAENNIKEKSFL